MENNPLELLLEKLHRAEAQLPPTEHSPNMLNLRQGLEAAQQALEELQASEAEIDSSTATAATAPHLFKARQLCQVQGLAHFLHAHALAFGGSGQVAGFAPMLEHVPQATSPGLQALGILKILCNPTCMGAAGNPAEAARAQQQLGLLLEMLWPASTDPQQQEAQRLLASRQWVPAVPPAPPAADASEPSAPLQAPPPDTALAAVLRAALQQHCPSISLEDVRYCALVAHTQLGLEFAAAAAGEAGGGAGRSRPQQQMERVLVELQLLISSGDPRWINSLLMGAQTAALIGRYVPNTASRRQLLREYLEGAVEHATQAKCWLTASEVARFTGTLTTGDLRLLARGARPAAAEVARLQRQRRERQQQEGAAAAGGEADLTFEGELRARTERVIQQLRELEPRIKPWAPTFSLQRLREERRSFERQLGLRPAGGAEPASGARSFNELPRCSACNRPALQLKKCAQCRATFYCSRQCQLQHWRSGHKRECAQLAQQRAD